MYAVMNTHNENGKRARLTVVLVLFSAVVVPSFNGFPAFFSTYLQLILASHLNLP